MNTDKNETAKTANRRDGYLLPDHWILPLREPNLWTMDHEAYVRRAVELVVQSGALNVLEVGCGDGWNCGKLAEAGLQVVGIDWSANGIDHARRHVPSGRFLCCDITDAAFRDLFPEPFDAIAFIEVIEHIPPIETTQALARIRACLKPSGKLILTTPSVNWPNNNSQHYRHFTADLLRAEIEKTGSLRVVSIEGYGDATVDRWFYGILRFFNNRYFAIKPIRDWAFKYYAQHYTRNTPLDRCRGLILVAEAF